MITGYDIKNIFENISVLNKFTNKSFKDLKVHNLLGKSRGS